MTTALTSAVELLDRSLGYTRVALAEVEAVPVTAPTPCHGWPLGRLLAHMDDALSAWTEAATGRVATTSGAGDAPLERIRDRSCALLGWWLEHDEDPVRVGDRWLPADVLVGAAALEITLHGWDLHETSGHPAAVPERLARQLLGLAAVHHGPEWERMPCLAPPVPPAPGASSSHRLLAFCGRS